MDEEAEKENLSAENASASDMALRLATLKAVSVSAKDRTPFVIGADQTMQSEGRLFDKPLTIDDARDHLLALAGKTHTLYNGIIVAQGGNVIWQHQAEAHLRMRPLKRKDIDAYLAAANGSVLSSVGCYRLEDIGSRLFEHIDGDYFTILGLPLLPLLAYLREARVID